MKAANVARIAGQVAATGAAAYVSYRYLVRPWHLRWGATDAEVAHQLPGDEEVRQATLVGTRAVTIDAPPEAIWPWLVQIGKGRGGFYSYDWIENLMGLGIKSSDTILAEAQALKVGDMIPGLGPVTAVEPNHFLLLAAHEEWGAVSWVLALQPLDEHYTRLISRTRYNLNWGTMLRALPPQLVPFYLFFEPGEFIMLRKMLLGIKQRVEAQAKVKPGEGAATLAEVAEAKAV